MFIKGIKKVLIVLCLAVSSSMLFVACKKTTVKVSSVSFIETESITMIVGQTYLPGVNVAPSYANNKGYELAIESGDQILKVEGNTIVALKEGVAQLKVVSNENKYLNDIISVQVLPKAIELEKPESLKFNGDKFTFASVDYATSYYIKINNEKEVELGNSTSFSLKQYEEVFSTSAYNKVLNVKVRAVGDDRITIPSEYSKEISVLKIGSPNDFNIENNVLKFTKINKVYKYKLNLYSAVESFGALTILASDYDKVVEIDLTDYKEFLVGGQYFWSLICSNEDYEKFGSETVSDSDEIVLDFDVLATPKNLVISDYVLYWDAVLGADSYTLMDKDDNVLQNNITETKFNLRDSFESGKSYSYKLVANSNKTVNVVSSINYSSILNVKVLDKPEAMAKDKTITWSKVDGANSYKLIIAKGGQVQKEVHLATNSYSVAGFNEGEYEYAIYSCGDNLKTLTSLDCEVGTFEVLPSVSNIRVENKAIYWESEKGNKFNLKIYDGTSEPYINQTIEAKTLDISQIVFYPNKEYKIEIQAIGEGNVFDSKIKKSETSIYKLGDISKIEISNKVLSLTLDGRTVRTEMEIFNSQNEKIDNLLSATSKSSYSLNADELVPGVYYVKAKAYGNNANILDSNNEIVLNDIIKLGIPSIGINIANPEYRYVYFEKNVSSAVNYVLYLNGKSVEYNEKCEYQIQSGITPGEYEFKIKAFGNNKNVLDGEMSSNSVKVLKLTTPTLKFNAETLAYTIQTDEEQDSYVESYEFSVNDSAITWDKTNKTLDCSSLFMNSGKYSAKFKLQAKTTAGIYDLIVDSNEISNDSAEKICSNAQLFLEGNKIIIKPTDINSQYDKYSPTIKIFYGGNKSVEYTEAQKDSSKGYVIEVFDSDYNVTGPRGDDGNLVFANAGEFTFTLKLERKGYITSDESENLGKITKLLEVKNIHKKTTFNSNDKKAPVEALAFDQVLDASKYLLRLTLNSKVYVTSFDNTKSSLSVADIKELFKNADITTPKAVTINGGTTSYLEFIAVGNDDNKILTSNPTSKYKIQLITWPTLNVENDVLTISINNKDAGVIEKAYVNVGTSFYEVLDIKGKTSTTLDLSKIKNVTTGDIKVFVTFCGSKDNNNVFMSNPNNITYNQLDKPTLSVVDGLLTWDIDENAKAYVLTYTDGEGITKTKTLTQGVENFSIADAKAYYELKTVVVDSSTIAVQAIGKGIVTSVDDKGAEVKKYYYNSPISEEIVVEKLKTPTVSVVNGEIVINLNETHYNSGYIKSVKLNGKDISLEETIKINGYDLLEYNSNEDGSIKTEKFTLSVQAKSSEDVYVLNAEDIEFEANGLKAVSNIRINTTHTPEAETTEIIDSILWDANDKNTGLVKGYHIEISFGGKIYSYDIDNLTNFTFPKHEDFGDGEYRISIRTLTDKEGYVHSKLSEEFIITVCNKPTNIKTVEGVVNWGAVTGATDYFVQIYNGETEEKLKTVHVTETTFDFEQLSECKEDLYKIRLYATSLKNNQIVSSKVSDFIEVYRIPEITKYKVENGELYLYTHSYTSKIEVTLTAKNLDEACNYTIEQTEQLPTGENWSNVANLESYLTKENVKDGEVGWSYRKVEIEENAILNILSDQYDLTVKAIGNTTSVAQNASVSLKSTVNSIVSSPVNIFEEKNYAQKIRTPNVEVADRGVVTFGLPVVYTDFIYDKLEKLVIYEVNLSVDGNDYSFYAVDNYYVGCLNSVENVTIKVYEETDKHTYYGYIKYEYEEDKYIYLNILRYKESSGAESYTGALAIDFKNEYLYFVDKEGSQIELKLADGGNYKVSASIVGDDTVYLTSNVSDAKNVVRFKQLNLTTQLGYLSWENITVSNNKIYLLSVKDFENVESLVYVYDTNVFKEEKDLNKNTLPRTIEGKTYFVGVNCGPTVDYIAYMFDTKVDNNYVFNAGRYSVNITTYFTDGSDNSRLEAIASSNIEFDKLSIPTAKIGDETVSTVKIEDGIIKWDKVKVGSKYISNYLLEIIKGDTTISFEVSNTSNSTAIQYELPESVFAGNVEGLIGEDNKFEISISAICKDASSYINSNKSDYVQLSISDYVSNINMNEGKLVWNGNASRYKIKIEVYDESENHITTCEKEVNTTQYDLDSSLVDIYGDTISLTYKYSYKFYIKQIGSGSKLTGYYKDSFVSERLKTVDDGAWNGFIKTNNGILTWAELTNINKQSITDISYVITVVGTNNEITVSDTSFDFGSFDYGEYTVQITPKHNTYFIGNISNSYKVYKLPAVDKLPERYDSIITNPTIDGIQNVLEWKATYCTIKGVKVYADKYALEIYDSNNLGEPIISTIIEDNEKIGVIRYSLAEQAVKDIEVRVKAMVTGGNNNLINSDWSEYVSFERPNPIKADTFVINNEKFRFEWKAIEDEQEGDSYILKYKFKETKDDSSIGKSIQITAKSDKTQDSSNYDSKNNVYYYVPNVIGYYTDISITVIRAGKLSSETITMKLDEQNNAEYVFDLFKAGEGSEGSPYQIESVEQLKNIDIFPDKYFVLISNIENSGINSMLITNEFSGVFDGNNKTISNISLVTENENIVGLFRSLKGATIKNLTINYATLAVKNTYGVNNTSMFYAGIIAGKVENSTIDNVSVLNSVVQIDSENDDKTTNTVNSHFYYGGMFGYVSGTTITNSNITLISSYNGYNTILSHEGRGTDKVYFGGVAGYVDGTTFAGTAEQFSVVSLNYAINIVRLNDKYPTVNFGGIFGVLEETNISYVKVTLKQNDTDNAGILSTHAGVCGYIIASENDIELNNIEVTGTIYDEYSENDSGIYGGTNYLDLAKIKMYSCKNELEKLSNSK